MSVDLKTIRNIGIAAHIDAGKTTTTERILYYSGTTHLPGEVDQATTKTDFDPQEQERGITIFSAAVSLVWQDCTINLIDTPGHVDFTAEVERCLRVLDGAIAVFDAKEGVEPQSETVWRQADKYKVPRLCFVNKMDKVGADFEASFRSIEKRLGAHPIAMQIPIGAESGFEGVIDLLRMKALRFDEGSKGKQVAEEPIPEALLPDAEAWRAQMIEKAADFNEELMTCFLEEQPIDVALIKSAVRAGTIARKLHPVFCGSSLKFVGVQPLLDAVCDYLPSPLETPPIEGTSAGLHKKGEKVAVPTEPDDKLVALIFKIIADKPLDLYFIRIYAGRLRAGSRLVNANTNEKENVTRIFRMFAKRRDQIDVATAGDVVAVLGPKSSLTGHTLCDPARPVVLEEIVFPDTVISQSIEPKSSKDRDKLVAALSALTRQDPTFATRTDPDTGQTLISGMGELHLEVTVRRLLEELRIPVNVGKPRASYRETITRVAEEEGVFDRQVGGKQHFASVKLRLEPITEGPASQTGVEFENRLDKEALEPRFAAMVKLGCMDASSSGPRGGYPLVGLRAILIDARQHETDSSEMAFEAASLAAINRAAAQAGPALLEPIMHVIIHTPDDYFGSISGDLNARRAIITGTDLRGESRVIDAEVPLSELFGYVTRLRSMSQGRASATMTPSRYAIMPDSIADQLVGASLY